VLDPQQGAAAAPEEATTAVVHGWGAQEVTRVAGASPVRSQGCVLGGAAMGCGTLP
jgi:hypothetical protein